MPYNFFEWLVKKKKKAHLLVSRCTVWQAKQCYQTTFRNTHKKTWPGKQNTRKYGFMINAARENSKVTE